MPITDAERRQIHSLSSDGLSQRDIAKAVGCAQSTVHDVLAANGNGGPPEPDDENLAVDGPPQVQIPDVEEMEYTEELRVDGTTQLGLIDFGGKKPQTASIRLSGGKIALQDGRAFRKGDVITFQGTAVVREVGARDQVDAKTGLPVSAEQRHVAQITGLNVITS